jgi:hypothetical protein
MNLSGHFEVEHVRGLVLELLKRTQPLQESRALGQADTENRVQ